jgi:predicted Zn-dependent peptidase
VTLTTLSRHFEAGLELLADLVQRPRLVAPDFDRVRDLRRSRLLQASRTPGAIADRAILAAVFGDHPYGHGALGTTKALDAVTLDEVRSQWAASWGPARATLLVAGDLEAGRARAGARRAFGDWAGAAHPPAPVGPPTLAPDHRIRVVDRPGAAQSELRIGHAGPPRLTSDYHALLTLNALLGGQFTSRINRNLREVRAITYGARSSFEMRRAGGLFSCDTSVQADATADAVSEILREFADVAAPDAIGDAELAHAKASLTRGYVRQFETASQLARAMAQLVTYGLDEDTFDRFVPEVEQLVPSDLTRVARTALRPADASVVVVGDLTRIGSTLDGLGREVIRTPVEF